MYLGITNHLNLSIMEKFLRILSAVLILSVGFSLWIGNNILTAFCLISTGICLFISEKVQNKKL